MAFSEVNTVNQHTDGCFTNQDDVIKANTWHYLFQTVTEALSTAGDGVFPLSKQAWVVFSDCRGQNWLQCIAFRQYLPQYL